MSSSQDPARLIAERVARRLAATPVARDRDESGLRKALEPVPEKPRARVIDFIATAAPQATRPSIAPQPEAKSPGFEARTTGVAQFAQSPWLAPFGRVNELPNAQTVSHPSQERFGVEEAAVSELVEFFENEKQCSVDPSGQPCDHCAMCSSRGF
ncbi:MAG TPA: hypothetical protein VKD91_07730 [Pyrinomonadaceae bacterium]|nr:hypothetical protein [Pyrinomonadaceae bacterium]